MNEFVFPQRDKLKAEIRNFASSLEKKYSVTIRGNEGSFRNFVLGTLKAHLPRGRPGVIPNSVVKEALKLYQQHKEECPEKKTKADWRHIAEKVIPGFSELSSEIQKYRIMKLRANVHSATYDEKSREKRRACYLRE